MWDECMQRQRDRRQGQTHYSIQTSVGGTSVFPLLVGSLQRPDPRPGSVNGHGIVGGFPFALSKIDPAHSLRAVVSPDTLPAVTPEVGDSSTSSDPSFPYRKTCQSGSEPLQSRPMDLPLPMAGSSPKVRPRPTSSSSTCRASSALQLGQRQEPCRSLLRGAAPSLRAEAVQEQVCGSDASARRPQRCEAAGVIAHRQTRGGAEEGMNQEDQGGQEGGQRRRK